MSFSSVFDTGLSDNATRLTALDTEYADEITNCQAETTELGNLDGSYASLTAEKIASNTSVCDVLGDKRTRISNIQTKITTMQGLSAAQKASLYQAYVSSGMRPRRFMDIALDRYATIISRVDPIIADGTLSTENRDKLITFMIREERILQKQNATDRLNYLVTNF